MSVKSCEETASVLGMQLVWVAVLSGAVSLSLLHEPPILYLDCVCKRLIVLAKERILFDGLIERFKEEHAGEGVSDIEDMVRGNYEEEAATV